MKKEKKVTKNKMKLKPFDKKGTKSTITYHCPEESCMFETMSAPEFYIHLKIAHEFSDFKEKIKDVI